MTLSCQVLVVKSPIGATTYLLFPIHQQGLPRGFISISISGPSQPGGGAIAKRVGNKMIVSTRPSASATFPAELTQVLIIYMLHLKSRR